MSASCIHKKLEKGLAEEVEKNIQNMHVCNQKYFVYNLGSDPYLFLNSKDTYFLWKKHGLVVKTEMIQCAFDSCFKEQMNEMIENYYGLKFMNMIRSDLDSILESKKNTDEFDFVKAYFYHDGVASFLPSPVYKNMVNALIIDEKKQYILLDSLHKKLQNIELLRPIEESYFISYWYTVDTLGNLYDIEIPNCYCDSLIRDLVFSTYSQFKWEPAVFNNKKVFSRYEDFLFIK